ncbi:AMP-binding domain protein [Coniochaeta ligniaria NRRL 30616]|uniref:AMP-binding domain protein n=1 Tax=Coniochaeta ligniaria NRRL 30616 TaxID=1408157 RepID=A0A1J7J1P3_9PEZI|nr:AMP-binding domain protein [Coniochaeta ligniaria NRRL 30616]
MSNPPSRLRNILGHLIGGNPQPQGPSAAQDEYTHTHHIHQLSPTFFLERAAAIEPDAEAIYHVTANGRILRRSYIEFADRARGLAYYLIKHGYKRVGVLAPNTPAFLESIYGIVAGGGVIVPVNYRLKQEDIAYIFDFAEVDAIVVDAEYVHLLDLYKKDHARTPVIIDNDTDATEGELSGPFDDAVLEGLNYDIQNGAKGWAGLPQVVNEDDMLAIPFTSGTTSKPKGVVYTHRGAYLAALANVIESGLNYHKGRCKYLWTLPMFHAIGWTFPWSVVAVRGTNVCLRKIDYPLIWRLLKQEGITHFNAAPTVNTLLCASPEAAALPDPVRVTVAASPPTAHLFEQMTKLNLHPVHVYGLTETYGPITKGYHLPHWDGLPDHEKFALMARQGHGFITSLPVRVCKPELAEQGRLVDVARDGKEIGEIMFLGNICAKEYYKDPEATRKLFAGGAMHSGDLAVWHADGSIQIQDRAKDIIISGGENISSVALESMLVEHPDVLEAGVVAVADSHWGERPKAYITVKEGKQMDGQSLIDWAKHQSSISKFMVPREVEVVKELPKTSTGKIKKNVLREWAKTGARE